MNTRLDQTLHRICDALQFDPTGTFTFGGSPSSQWASDSVKALQNALYAACYTREFNGAIEPSPVFSSNTDQEWLEMVSAANASQAHWEEGWQIQQFFRAVKRLHRKARCSALSGRASLSAVAITARPQGRVLP